MPKLTRQAYLRQMAEEQRRVTSSATAQRKQTEGAQAEASGILPFSALQSSVLRFQQTRGNQAMLRVMRTARDAAANRVQRVEGEEKEKEKEKDPARVEGPSGGPALAAQFTKVLNFWQSLENQAEAGDQGSGAYGSPDMEANREVPMNAYGRNDYDDDNANDSDGQRPAGAYGNADNDNAADDDSTDFDGDTHYEDPDLTYDHDNVTDNSFDGMPNLEDHENTDNAQGQPPTPAPVTTPVVHKRKARRYRHLRMMEGANLGENIKSTKKAKWLADGLLERADAKTVRKVTKKLAANKDVQFLAMFKQKITALTGWTEEDMNKYLDLDDHDVKGDNFEVDDLDNDPNYRFDDRPEVNYLQGDEKKQFQVKGNGGTLMQGNPPQPYSTDNDYSKFSGKGYAIYVMSPDGKFYAGTHKVGLFHHSSFLAGGDVAGGGEWKVENGSLKVITNKSGHYKPGDDQMLQTLNELQARGVNLGPVVLKLLTGNGMTVMTYPGGAAKFLQDKGRGNHVADEL